jgi:hypothetical protein
MGGGTGVNKARLQDLFDPITDIAVEKKVLVIDEQLELACYEREEYIQVAWYNSAPLRPTEPLPS